jgi:hypothetical protein
MCGGLSVKKQVLMCCSPYCRIRNQCWSKRHDKQYVSLQNPQLMDALTGLNLTLLAGEEFRNDPRNPNAKTVKPADKH